MCVSTCFRQPLMVAITFKLCNTHMHVGFGMTSSCFIEFEDMAFGYCFLAVLQEKIHLLTSQLRSAQTALQDVRSDSTFRRTQVSPEPSLSTFGVS